MPTMHVSVWRVCISNLTHNIEVITWYVNL
jgi:hypothetical protein